MRTICMTLLATACLAVSACSGGHATPHAHASSTESAPDQAFLNAVSNLALPRSDGDLIDQAHQFCTSVSTTSDTSVLSSLGSNLGTDPDGTIAFANAAVANYCPTKHAAFPAAAPTTPSTDVAPPTAKTSGPAGTTLNATDSDSGGSFDITVGKPLALALQSGTPNRTLGVPITIANVSGAPSFETGYLGLAPTSLGTSGDDGSIGIDDASTAALYKTACKAMKTLSAAMEDAAVIDAAGSSYDLSELSSPTVTGCVTFAYDPPDAPKEIELYDNFPSGDSSDNALLTWSITLPKTTMTPTPHITVDVFGNGSRAGTITYAIDTHISQNTDARIPWSKQLDTGGNFYQVSAQDQDGTSITCEIIDADGSVLDKETSTGRFAIASCSAIP